MFLPGLGLGREEDQMSHKHGLNRRDFLKLSGLGLGGATLAACERKAAPVKLTAIPPPANRTAVPANPAVPSAAPLAPGEPADAVLVNGNIVTMDARRTTVKALAIKGGLIVLVGDEAAAPAATGATTQIIDLHGRTVTPGLIDAHCHLSACGLLGTVYVDISWPAIRTIAQMQAKVAERIAKTPAGEWVAGNGWVTYDGRYPNKHDIDPISPRNPVMLINQGGHLAAVNSYALQLASVNS